MNCRIKPASKKSIPKNEISSLQRIDNQNVEFGEEGATSVAEDSFERDHKHEIQRNK
jgi:hypothetical protein